MLSVPASEVHADLQTFVIWRLSVQEMPNLLSQRSGALILQFIWVSESLVSWRDLRVSEGLSSEGLARVRLARCSGEIYISPRLHDQWVYWGKTEKQRSLPLYEQEADRRRLR